MCASKLKSLFPKGKKKKGGPERPMKFPYTFAAKIAQFPYKFYIDKQWLWKYYFIGIGISLPVFFKISRLANSPENKAAHAAALKREAEEHAHHDGGHDDHDHDDHGGHDDHGHGGHDHGHDHGHGGHDHGHGGHDDHGHGGHGGHDDHGHGGHDDHGHGGHGGHGGHH